MLLPDYVSPKDTAMYFVQIEGLTLKGLTASDIQGFYAAGAGFAWRTGADAGGEREDHGAAHAEGAGGLRACAAC